MSFKVQDRIPTVNAAIDDNLSECPDEGDVATGGLNHVGLEEEVKCNW